MLEVILRSCVELCLFIGFQALKRTFEGIPNMTVRCLTNTAPTASQTIDFGSLNEDAVAVAVKSSDVRIVSSPGDHVSGSSKVRINNVVDYTWEEKFYSGQLLAVHMSGKFIAYGIKAVGNAGRNSGGTQSGGIRVVNRQTSARALIKGITGTVEDLAFAYMTDRYVLASIDSEGTLMVHVIMENGKDIACQLVLTTVPGEPIDHKNPKRVFWCPYIPDEAEDHEDGWLLALTRGSKIELWSVSAVTRTYGPGPLSAKTVTSGFIAIEASSTIISDAAFSPDGSAIATASHDGHCKFYQVYLHEQGEPRLLHEWEPHDGEPVNTLFFLDDHVNPQNDIQFWKYAVTGAKDNCEIKVWSCETWECLQKISLTTRSSRHSRGWGKLKATIDLSAGYILLSDMYLRLFYVLELQKDAENVVQPFVQTITEFKLPCPILSFGVVDASLKTLEKNAEPDIEELCNGDSEDDPQKVVVVRMYFVQPKSVQECQIVFQTSNAIEVHHNMLHNVSASLTDNIAKKEVDEENNAAPILMTPDAFHSPHQSSSRSSPPTVQVGASPTPPPPAIPAPDPQELPPPPAAIVSQNDPSFVDIAGPFTSCGSSPSREVEEILSTTKTKITAKMLEDFVQQESKTEKVKALEANVCTLMAEVCSLKAENAAHAALTESVLALLTQQAHDLKTLKEEIRRSNVEKPSGAALEALIVRAVTGTLASQPQPKVDVDSIATRVSSTVSSDIGRQLSLSVAKHFKDEIKPAFIKEVDSMKNLLHSEVSHKLNITDQAFKETLGKTLRSKNMVDALSHSFNVTASAAMEEVIKDTVVKVAVPVLEKAANVMFQQINLTFSEGMKECQKELESYASRANERTNIEINALQTSVDHLNHATKKFSSTIDKDLKRLDETITELGRSLNKMSLNNGSIRSGSVTPAPHMVDSQVLQAQISQLINQGQVNTAFQQALSASDLNLVLYCCEKVGTQQVFNGPGGCLLQQHVLLSLIQQLSADMSHHTETNHKYIEEAIMCLDVNNKNTREYMPGVLANLSKQLQLYVAANPNGRLTKKAKMLQMATQSLLSPQQQ